MRAHVGSANAMWLTIIVVALFVGTPFVFVPMYREFDRRRVAEAEAEKSNRAREEKRKPEPNVRRVFDEDGVRCLEIRGHLFLMSRIVNHGHGSVGSTSLLHAPFCPCHTNATSEVAQ